MYILESINTEILLEYQTSSISVVPRKWTLYYKYILESIFGALLKYCLNIKPAQSQQQFGIMLWTHQQHHFSIISVYFQQYSVIISA